MNEQIIVDSNVFMNYAQSKGTALRFFARVEEFGHEVYVLPDVYVELKAVTSEKEFNKINSLINELKYHYQSYHKVEITNEEKELAERLIYVKDRFGDPLDRTDRRIIVIAKTRGYYICSEDSALNYFAKQLGCKVF